jgi:hypothetical protein
MLLSFSCSGTTPASDWISLDAKHEKALRVVTDNLDAVEDAVVLGARRTDSPLEAQFKTWFDIIRGFHLSLGSMRFAVALRPQVWIECASGPRYRLDFAVEPMEEWLHMSLLRAGHPLKLGVELDGHDFHEKTRAQVTCRNQRDRDLSTEGWRVLHFSGSLSFNRLPYWRLDDVNGGAPAAL